MSPTVEQIAGVLAKHTRDDAAQYVACICGWTHVGGYPTGARPHTNHVAAVIADLYGEEA